VLAPPAFVASLVVATFLNPGYSHLRQTVSELAAPGTPHPEVIQAGFIAYDVLVLGLTASLFVRFRNRRGALVLPALLVLYSAGGILAAFFRDDVRDPVVNGTTAGELHDAAAFATFGVILAAILVATWVWRRDPAWRWFVWFSLAMFALTGVFGLLFELHESVDLHGFYQRGFFVTTMLWVEVLSLRLLLIARTADDRSARLR
jgi:hypothetical protein